MNRSQMLAILSNMSDDKLVEAMSATGIPMEDEGFGLGPEQADGVESWNARDVPMQDPQKPAFFDKAKFIAPQPGAMRPQYANPNDGMDDLTAFLPQQMDQQ